MPKDFLFGLAIAFERAGCFQTTFLRQVMILDGEQDILHLKRTFRSQDGEDRLGCHHRLQKEAPPWFKGASKSVDESQRIGMREIAETVSKTETTIKRVAKIELTHIGANPSYSQLFSLAGAGGLGDILLR